MFAFCPSTKILTIFACINKTSQQLKSHFYIINYTMGNRVTVNLHTTDQYHNTNITRIPVSLFFKLIFDRIITDVYIYKYIQMKN